ncbi:unnamed protein product [Nippostrongylus brasiliensis]|uniref:ULP_PROTEASE domain-containing protein n=1 Tax=Nippostrongylus brasiliensis TaxID=27835 RepID=A0A0N4XYJ2_NIPBR|nr:unnamed protein product [Nippostrongylus brasiliensis]
MHFVTAKAEDLNFEFQFGSKETRVFVKVYRNFNDDDAKVLFPCSSARYHLSDMYAIPFSYYKEPFWFAEKERLQRLLNVWMRNKATLEKEVPENLKTDPDYIRCLSSITTVSKMCVWLLTMCWDGDRSKPPIPLELYRMRREELKSCADVVAEMLRELSRDERFASLDDDIVEIIEVVKGEGKKQATGEDSGGLKRTSDKKPPLNYNAEGAGGDLVDLDRGPSVSKSASVKDDDKLVYGASDKKAPLNHNAVGAEGDLVDVDRSPSVSKSASVKDEDKLEYGISDKKTPLSYNAVEAEGDLVDVDCSPSVSKSANVKDENKLSDKKAPLNHNAAGAEGDLVDVDRSPSVSKSVSVKDESQQLSLQAYAAEIAKVANSIEAFAAKGIDVTELRNESMEVQQSMNDAGKRSKAVEMLKNLRERIADLEKDESKDAVVNTGPASEARVRKEDPSFTVGSTKGNKLNATDDESLYDDVVRVRRGGRNRKPARSFTPGHTPPQSPTPASRSSTTKSVQLSSRKVTPVKPKTSSPKSKDCKLEDTSPDCGRPSSSESSARSILPKKKQAVNGDTEEEGNGTRAQAQVTSSCRSAESSQLFAPGPEHSSLAVETASSEVGDLPTSDVTKNSYQSLPGAEQPQGFSATNVQNPNNENIAMFPGMTFQSVTPPSGVVTSVPGMSMYSAPLSTLSSNLQPPPLQLSEEAMAAVLRERVELGDVRNTLLNLAGVAPCYQFVSNVLDVIDKAAAALTRKDFITYSMYKAAASVGTNHIMDIMRTQNQLYPVNHMASLATMMGLNPDLYGSILQQPNTSTALTANPYSTDLQAVAPITIPTTASFPATAPITIPTTATFPTTYPTPQQPLDQPTSFVERDISKFLL